MLSLTRAAKRRAGMRPAFAPRSVVDPFGVVGGRTMSFSSSASARRKPLVHRDGLLEVVIFLARNKAEVFQFGEHLLGPGGLAKHQIGLAKMLAGAAVAGIEGQRPLIVAHGRLQLTQSSICIADVVLDIGIGGVPQR